MSEFLAEASVLIRPDTTAFRAELEAKLAAIKIAPIAVPITAVGAGLAGATAATASLTAAQSVAQKASLGLAGTEQVLTSTFGKQAVILDSLTPATLRQAGAQTVLDAANKKSAASLLGAGTAAGRMDAALLGLRTAVGSSAVIGLGALALAAIVAGKAIRASITDFAAFQQELASFRVIAGATADQMKSVSDESRRLGQDVRLPAVSSADAAVAMTELAKAGLSVEDAIAGARGVLELATAAQISNGEAALIAANALNAFGLAGDQASRVADDLANAANAAQGSISDFGQAFAQASAVARQVGLSLEDTTSILSLFAKNGLQGSDAGTSLRVALIKLVAPTKAAREEIEKLGLNIRDAQGNVRPDIFAQFGEATRDLSPAARDAAAALIFGQDAIRAVSIGAREGVHGLRLMQFQIDQTGTAAEVAGARTEGLAGAFGALQSSSQTLGVDFGRIVSVGLTPFVNAAADAALVTDKLIVKLSELGSGAAHILGPLGKVADSFNRLVSSGDDKIPAVDELERLGFINIDENTKKISNLRDELIGLQKARAAGQDLVPGLSDQLTARIERLKDQIKGLKDEGAGITSSLTKPLQDAIAQLEKVRDRKIEINADTSGIDKLIAKFKAQIPVAQETARENARLTRGVGDLATSSINAAGGVDFLTKALKNLGTQSAQTQAELLKLQTEGGTPGQQIGVLQSDIATQRQIIEKAKQRGGSGTATAITKAREQIKSDQAAIDSLRGQLEADANKAQAAADKLRTAREKATQAFIDSFSSQEQKRLNAITTAGLSKGLQDDINTTKKLITFFKSEIDAIKKRINAMNLHGDALKIAQTAIAAINQKIFSARNEIAKLTAEQTTNQAQILQEASDARQTHLESVLSIAETTTGIRDDRRALEALIAFDTKQISRLKNLRHRTQEQNAQLDAYRVDLAQRNQALRELKKEGDKASSIGFDFLQKQQGFAANLLGNLIPGGATGGLVGGGAGPVSTLQGPTSPAQGVQTAAAISGSRDNPLTRGDVQTELHLLRSILNVLRDGNSKGDHPEAWFNRRVSGAAMDTFGA